MFSLPLQSLIVLFLIKLYAWIFSRNKYASNWLTAKTLAAEMKGTDASLKSNLFSLAFRLAKGLILAHVFQMYLCNFPDWALHCKMASFPTILRVIFTFTFVTALPPFLLSLWKWHSFFRVWLQEELLPKSISGHAKLISLSSEIL